MRALDSSWHLTLRTSDNHDASRAMVWVRPGDRHVELLMGVAQTSNGVLTRFTLDQKRFHEWLEHEEAQTAMHR